jgi:hypothetical protein
MRMSWSTKYCRDAIAHESQRVLAAAILCFPLVCGGQEKSGYSDVQSDRTYYYVVTALNGSDRESALQTTCERLIGPNCLNHGDVSSLLSISATNIGSLNFHPVFRTGQILPFVKDEKGPSI